MATIQVTITNNSGSDSWNASVSNNVPARDVTRQIVLTKEYPTSYQTQPLSYRLHHKQSGKILNPQQSLEDGGVLDGHTLRLQAELRAGAD